MSYLTDDQVNLLKQAVAEPHAPVAVCDCDALALQPGEQAVVPVKWEGRMPLSTVAAWHPCERLRACMPCRSSAERSRIP